MDDDATIPDYIGSAFRGTNRVLAMPLIGKVDTVHLFLLMGAVLLSSLIWSRVLAHIKG